MPAEPKKLAKGLEPCSACGKIVAPAKRRRAHSETAQCRATVVEQAFTARGWLPLKDLGVYKRVIGWGLEAEIGLSGLHYQKYATVALGTIVNDPDLDPTKHASGRVVNEWTNQEQHEQAYAPAVVVAAVELTTRIPLAPSTRAAIVRGYVQHEEFRRACDAARALGQATAFTLRKLAQENGVLAEGAP